MSSHSSPSFLSPGGQSMTKADAKSRGTLQRPSFSSNITSDRLRESERWPSPQLKANTSLFSSASRTGTPTGGRRSVFKEIGLEDFDLANTTGTAALRSSTTSPTSAAGNDRREKGKAAEDTDQRPWYSKLAKSSRPVLKSAATAPPATFSTLPRVATLAFLIAIVIPGLRYRGTGDLNVNVPADGVGAGPIDSAELMATPLSFGKRANSPTDICTRWAHQGAVVNGTLYVYGGQVKTSSSQSSNTWNNDFLTLDLTKSWGISNPSLTGLPQPSGPPAVAQGYLWNSFTSLFLYGGLFSDTPVVSPVPYSTWEYSLVSNTWIEHSNPTSTAGNNSGPAGVAVQRSAEGAGLSVPELGLSWYFGGHQDCFTTAGWSNQIERIYLKSLLEFTHPGFTNDGVLGLGPGKGASSDGAYRNITQGGIQSEAGFTERADGVLVYVPGWGANGILLGLAGGTNTTFTEMNVIDIFDIATTTWYKQATSGTSPPIRVDPCAVVFAAPDASSFNIYLYGGQNLQPYGGQTQYTDLWILTIPSFTWIQVDLSGQSQPPARAGHTCHAWNGQMLVVGGYVGTQISCDSPGIYVFNATSLQWQNNYVALSGGDSPNEQSTQNSGSGLSGSYGYEVPGPVQKVIGGGSYGSATATTPAAGSATAGPIATGRPPTFTVTQSGSTIIETAHSTATATSVSSSTPSSSPSSSSSSPNIGVIIAAAIAGILAVLAAYLAFCTWLYRRQLALYKNHVAMSQRTALGYSHSPENRIRSEKMGTLLGAFGTEIGGNSGNSSAPRSSLGGNSGPSSGPTAVRIDSNSTANRIFNSEEPTPMEYQGAAGVAATSDRGSMNSSTEDLLAGHEPSFISVILSPRRTLRVINRD